MRVSVRLAVVALLALYVLSATTAIATATATAPVRVARDAAAASSICDAYSTALGLSQFNFMDLFVSRVLSGVVDAEPALGGASGSFVTLTGYNTLEVISTANFGTAGLGINLNCKGVNTSNYIQTIARRPSTGKFYFMDQVGQLYNADVELSLIHI